MIHAISQSQWSFVILDHMSATETLQSIGIISSSELPAVSRVNTYPIGVGFHREVMAQLKRVGSSIHKMPSEFKSLAL